VVERKNRTLEDMARTMLCESNLPTSFWAKAVNAANYVLNRCLIRPILKKTPYELFKGRKPNISYFRVFGCKCFIHNNGKERLGKFDARSDEGILVGYSMNSKAYRVYNNRTKLIEESIDIVFDKSNDGKLSSSSSFHELKLSRYEDDEDGEDKRAKSNKEHEEAYQKPNDENNMTPTNESLHDTNEEEPSPSDPNEETMDAPRRGYKYKSYHPPDNLLTDISTGIRTRSFLRNFCVFSSFVSLIEPKNHLEALEDPNWIIAMQEELGQFKMN